MNERDRLIINLFTHIGYCTGVITGLEMRHRNHTCSEDEIFLYTTIQNGIAKETRRMIDWHNRILEEEEQQHGREQCAASSRSD